MSGWSWKVRVLKILVQSASHFNHSHLYQRQKRRSYTVLAFWNSVLVPRYFPFFSLRGQTLYVSFIHYTVIVFLFFSQQ
jgi:hypothetical protein